MPAYTNYAESTNEFYRSINTSSNSLCYQGKSFKVMVLHGAVHANNSSPSWDDCLRWEGFLFFFLFILSIFFIMLCFWIDIILRRFKHFVYYMILIFQGGRIHVVVKKGRLTFLDKYFKDDMVVVIRNFKVIAITWLTNTQVIHTKLVLVEPHLHVCQTHLMVNSIILDLKWSNFLT